MMIWSLSAVLTALTVSVVANDGLISIPFVAVDRKAAHIPAWKFQKVGSTVNVPLENIDLAVNNGFIAHIQGVVDHVFV